MGDFAVWGPYLLAGELFTVILALFFFGSSRYRIDKNMIAYGSLPIILATFLPLWLPFTTILHKGEMLY